MIAFRSQLRNRELPGRPGASLELVCFWPHPELEHSIEEFDDTIIVGHQEEGNEQ